MEIIEHWTAETILQVITFLLTWLLKTWWNITADRQLLHPASIFPMKCIPLVYLLQCLSYKPYIMKKIHNPPLLFVAPVLAVHICPCLIPDLDISGYLSKRSSKCVQSIILFYCSRSSRSLPNLEWGKYQTCLIFAIPRLPESDRSSKRAKEKEQTGKRRQTDVAYFARLFQRLYIYIYLLSQDFTHVLLPSLFIAVKHNPKLDGQPMTLMVLYICFFTEVTLDHWDSASVESPL